MLCRVEVRAGVSVRGVVAATDMSAFAAQPQMHSFAANLHAFLAAFRTRRYLEDRIHVRAIHDHVSFLDRSANRL